MTIDEARARIGHRVTWKSCSCCDLGSREGEIAAVDRGRVYVRFGWREAAVPVGAGTLTLLAAPDPTERRRAWRIAEG
jgi:hypothetical protein